MRRPPNCPTRTGRRAAPVLAAAALTLSMAPATAQQQLPPIVVEGDSLAVKPAKPAPKPKPQTPTPDAAAASGADSAQDVAAGASTTAPNDGDDTSAPAATSGAAGGDFAVSGVGASVAVVTRTQIDSQQIRHAAEALRALPGVSVARSGGFGGLTQVRIRGGEANHTLVLVDGVPANQATNGEFDFANLPAESIERIEVIKGPQSGLVGSNAMGGVINVVTKKGEGPLSMVMRAEAGAFGTHDLSGVISGGNSLVHGALTLHRRSTDGFDIAPNGREDDGARQELIAFKGGIRPRDTFAIDVIARRTLTRGDRDDDSRLPFGALAQQTDSASTFRWNTLLLGAEARLDTFDGFWTHAVRLSRNRTVYSDTLVDEFGESPYEDESGVDKAAYVATFRFATPGFAALHNTVTTMVEKEDEHYQPRKRAFDQDRQRRERNRVNTALEWQGVAFDRLTVSANVRHDDNETGRDYTTWRTTAAYLFDNLAPGLALRPHASYGTGVKYPSFFELYGSSPTFFTPNPFLVPEEAKGWDAGLEFRLMQGRAVFDVTYFSADITNKITGSLFGPPENLAGVSEHRGVELSARLALTQTLTLGLGYTYLDARTPDGRDELRRPPHAGYATLVQSFADRRGQLSLAARYVGDSTDQAYRMGLGNCGNGCSFTTYTPERVGLADYWLVSLAASYKMTREVELFARLENALDHNYQEVYGFETAGAAAYAGVKISLGGK